jgi:hypothetical protein
MRHIPRSLKDPIRKAHSVGSSVVVTIDPSHVKRLKIDDLTFFVQRSIENGIRLEIRRLQDSKEEFREVEKKNVVDGKVFQAQRSITS